MNSRGLLTSCRALRRLRCSPNSRLGLVFLYRLVCSAPSFCFEGGVVFKDCFLGVVGLFREGYFLAMDFHGLARTKRGMSHFKLKFEMEKLNSLCELEAWLCSLLVVV